MTTAAKQEMLDRNSLPDSILDTWLKVNDVLPFEGQEVEYYFDILGSFEGKFKHSWDAELEYNWECFYGNGGYLCDDVTHWRPVKTKDIALLYDAVLVYVCHDDTLVIDCFNPVRSVDLYKWLRELSDFNSMIALYIKSILPGPSRFDPPCLLTDRSLKNLQGAFFYDGKFK